MRRFLASFLLLGFLAFQAQAATTFELAVGSSVTALSTELNSLANNGFSAASSAIDNRIGQTMNGYMICRVIAHTDYAANPTAGGAVTGWFLKNHDPSSATYETTPTSSIGLNRLPDFVIPVVTGQQATDVSVDVRCPAERFKVVIKNDATGQAMDASGNTIKIIPITPQGN